MLQTDGCNLLVFLSLNAYMRSEQHTHSKKSNVIPLFVFSSLLVLTLIPPTNFYIRKIHQY